MGIINKRKEKGNWEKLEYDKFKREDDHSYPWST